MTITAGSVREWTPDGALLQRFRRRLAVVMAGILVAAAGLLVAQDYPLPQSTALLAAWTAFTITAVWVRRPTARGPQSGRAPQRTMPETVPAPSATDLPVERVGRVVRAAAAGVLVLVALWVGTSLDRSGAALAAAALAGWSLLMIDLPWLLTVHRLGRRPLARTTVTVAAVGVPRRGHLVLATDTVAWSVERAGVLHDAVVGDVLVADLDRDGAPLVLTLAERRSLAPSTFALSD